MASYKRLYRSSESRVFGGVAGGVADYLGMSKALVRIGFVAVFLFGGTGLLAYILMWMMVPRQPDLIIEIDDEDMFVEERGGRGDLIRALLIALPLAGLASLFSGHFIVFPFVLGLAIGLYYLWRSSDFREKFFADTLGLHRSENNRKIFGVFGGLADKWRVDPTILRVIGVVAVVAGVGFVIPLYLLYAFLVPVAPDDNSRDKQVIIV
jgi:phage shock protein C